MDDKKKQLLLFSLTAILTVISFVLTLVAVIQCNYIKVADVEYAELSIKPGLWSWYGNGECNSYPPASEIDASWMAARVFSCLSLVIGGMLVLFSLIMLCAVFSGEYGVAGHMGSIQSSLNTYGLDILAYLFTGIFTGLILLFLNSNACKEYVVVTEEEENSCQLASGAKLTISATIFWFFATFLCTRLDIERGNMNSRDSLSANYPTRPRPVASKV